MPTDPLKINEWVHGALGIAAQQVCCDPQLDETARRDELCKIAGRMAGLTPLSRISAAEDVVNGRHAGAVGGPQVQAVNDASQVAAVSTEGGGPPALRGRPRKRSAR